MGWLTDAVRWRSIDVEFHDFCDPPLYLDGASLFKGFGYRLCWLENVQHEYKPCSCVMLNQFYNPISELEWWIKVRLFKWTVKTKQKCVESCMCTKRRWEIWKHKKHGRQRKE